MYFSLTYFTSHQVKHQLAPPQKRFTCRRAKFALLLVTNNCHNQVAKQFQVKPAVLKPIALDRLSSLAKYYIPRDGSLQSYKDYIITLPVVDQPQAFGQHPNADITSLITETRLLCETLMSLQVQGGGSQESNKEEDVSVSTKLEMIP